MPSDGDHNTPTPKRRRPKRTLAKLRAEEKKLRREVNAMRHRGQMPAIDRMREFRDYLRQCVAAVQPFSADGTLRPGADMDLFFKFGDLFIRVCAASAPYETPRLAAVMFKQQMDEHEHQDYATVWEMHTRLIKRGIPVPQIEDRLIIDATPDDGIAG